VENIAAISRVDFDEFGCPHCGGKHKGSKFMDYDCCFVWSCDCGKEFVVVTQSVQEIEHLARDTDIENLCESHPHSQRPYDPEVSEIRDTYRKSIDFRKRKKSGKGKAVNE
jgi:hypothetical protein